MARHVIKYPLAVLLLSIGSYVFSQKLPFQYYTTDNGLPHSQVSSVYQDRNGFLWFLSPQGLVRYDGQEYLVYNKQDGFTSSHAVQLSEDSAGTLWALMINGLSGFQISIDGRIQMGLKLDYKNGLPSAEYSCLWVESGSSLWIGTRGAGLCHVLLDEQNGKPAVRRVDIITTERGMTSNFIHHVYPDQKHQLWVATDEGISVIRFLDPESRRFIIYKLSVRQGSLPSNYVYRITQDSSNIIWAATKKGLGKFIDVLESKSDNKFRNFGTREGLPSNTIYDVVVDRIGNLWIATASGVSKLKVHETKSGNALSASAKTSFISYGLSNGLIENTAISLFVDRENNLYALSPTGRISKLSAEHFHHFSGADLPIEPTGGPVVVDAMNRVWIGSNEGVTSIGITASSTEPGNYEKVFFGKTAGFSGSVIFDLTIDKSERPWVVTDEGVFLLQSGRWVTYPYQSMLPLRKARVLTFDIYGNDWIGTLSGLYRIRKGDVRAIHRAQGLVNDHIRVLFNDHNGTMWIGCRDGISFIRKEQLNEVAPSAIPLQDPELRGKTIQVIFEDRLHTIWIGTDAGLVKLEKNPVTDMYKAVSLDLNKLGFRDNSIISIAQETTGRLWIHTRKGVYVMNLEPLQVIAMHTRQSGLGGDEALSSKSMEVDKTGAVWISQIGAVTRYIPQLDIEFRTEPLLYIRRFYANEILQPVEQARELDYGSKDIEIEMVALSFINETYLAYQYYLEGFERSWSAPMRQKKIRYTNLDAGNYTFKFRIWPVARMEPSAVQSFAFTISPPFWKQWWFYIVSVLAAGTGLYGFYRNRIQKIRRLNEDLEHRIFMRTQEIRNQNEQIKKQQGILEQQKHDLELALKELTRTQNTLIHSKKMASLVQIVAGIAHEINNPLANIYGNSVMLKEYIGDIREMLMAYEEYWNRTGRQPLTLESGQDLLALKDRIDYDFLMEDIYNLSGSIEKSSQRIQRIVEDLRRFSRIDESEIKETDINESLKNIVQLFMNQYRFSLKIETHWGELPKLVCYPQDLNQAFMQILLNAAQAIMEYKQWRDEQAASGETVDGERGLITITTECIKPAASSVPNDIFEDSFAAGKSEEPIIQIRIRDDGIGIDDLHKEKIFDPFFTTRKIGEGTGLGLSVAYSIIEKHRGKIFLNSQRFQGSEFTIELPLHNHIKLFQ